MDFYDLLKKYNLTISVVESCTGGYLSHQLSKKAGSSKYYKGGIIAYNKDVKENILGVGREVDAVSEKCANQMVTGLQKIIDSDIYISVTGFAGPSAEPINLVGTIFFSILYKNKIFSFQKKYKSNKRLRNIKRVIKDIIYELMVIIISLSA